MRSTITSTTGTINALTEHSLETSARVSNRARRSFLKIGKHASGAQAEQRNRNRQKREVIKQHHGKQPGERQFKQQGGKAA